MSTMQFIFWFFKECLDVKAYREVLLKISTYILNYEKGKSVGDQKFPEERVGHNDLSP